jgi:hypothetical protein
MEVKPETATIVIHCFRTCKFTIESDSIHEMRAHAEVVVSLFIEL